MLPPPGSRAAGRCQPRLPPPAGAGHSGGRWSPRGAEGLPSSGAWGLSGRSPGQGERRKRGLVEQPASPLGRSEQGEGRGTPSEDQRFRGGVESGALALFSAPFLPTQQATQLEIKVGFNPIPQPNPSRWVTILDSQLGVGGRDQGSINGMCQVAFPKSVLSVHF